MIANKFLALLVLAAASGCTAAVTPTATLIVAPDGTPAVAVECSAGTSACLVRVSQACPQGYTVLNVDQGIDSSSRGYANSQVAISRSDAHTVTTMVVECRDGRAPRVVEPTCSPAERSNMGDCMPGTAR